MDYTSNRLEWKSVKLTRGIVMDNIKIIVILFMNVFMVFILLLVGMYWMEIYRKRKMSYKMKLSDRTEI